MTNPDDKEGGLQQQDKGENPASRQAGAKADWRHEL